MMEYKKTSQSKMALFTLLVLVTMANCKSKTESTIIYEGLVQSELFKVKIDNAAVFTEKYTSTQDIDKLPDWFSAPYVREVQEMHIADFTLSEAQKIEILVAVDFSKVTVRPLSKKIVSDVKSRRISLDMSEKGYLIVEIDTLPPLFLLANEKEEMVPSPDNEKVLYFGPGIHEPGYIELKNDQTVYIAKGAIVYGGLRGDSVSNVTVMGRGILDGRYHYERMVMLDNCRDITVEGIMIRNSKGWTNTITNCDNVMYSGVKVISFGPGGDGINPLNSRNVSITGCFLRCTDDCIAIKSPHYGFKSNNIKVENNTMIGFAYSDGVTIGYETNEDITSVNVKNCDVLMARGGSRVDGHSGFSIICDGPGIISDVTFEDIRVERAEDKLFELNITDGTKYGIDPPGHIRDVNLKNIQWLHSGPMIITGYDMDHPVKKVTFEDCTIADKPLMDVYPEILDTQHHAEEILIVRSGVEKAL